MSGLSFKNCPKALMISCPFRPGGGQWISLPPSLLREERPPEKAAAMTSASIFVMGSWPFDSESSRRAELSGESCLGRERQEHRNRENCGPHVLAPFTLLDYRPPMPDAELAPAARSVRKTNAALFR
jgi:hypothetical protein